MVEFCYIIIFGLGGCIKGILGMYKLFIENFVYKSDFNGM